MIPPDFDELISDDVDDLERARLRRVHDLLVAAGPPADMPATLAARQSSACAGGGRRCSSPLRS